MGSLITFSRRKKGGGVQALQDSSSCSQNLQAECDARQGPSPSAATTYLTAPSVLTPIAESPVPFGDADSVTSTADSAAKDGRQQRRRAPSLGRARAASQAAYLAELKAHFDEVDAFQLVVETPTPKKKAGRTKLSIAAGTQLQENHEGAGQLQALPSATKLRPMSLGLSRRSSMVALPGGLASTRKSARPSLPRPSVPGAERRFPLSSDQVQEGQEPGAGAACAAAAGTERRASAVGDNMGHTHDQHRLPVHRRQSAAVAARVSMTGGMMSRLSLGLSDALQWLGIRGSLPAAQQQQPAELAEEHVQPVKQEGPSAWVRNPAGMSPIGEEPVSSSPAVPTSPCPASEAPNLAYAAERTPQHQPAGAEAGSDSVAAALVTRGQPGEAVTCSEDQTVAELRDQLQTKLVLIQPALTEPSCAATAAESNIREEAAAEAAVKEAISGEATVEGAMAGGSQAEEDLTPLQQLLLMCGQELDVEQLPSMDILLGRHVDLSKVRKIGEGTFGEAFKAGGVVFKIVPMEGEVLVNGEVQKRADEILAEAAITLTLSGLRGPREDELQPENVTSGFVETYGVGVCRGQYAALLKKEWHRWDEKFGSENDPVDIFGDGQLFVVFVVADGGLDLEHYEIRSFKELRSILLQVCLTLAVAEEGCEFEHRDLHWGNLLIQRDGSSEVTSRLRACDVRAQTAGVTVTLIDFTLSRLVTTGGEAVFCNLAADPELFKGPKGDAQAETYRRMKKATKNKWETFVPATNCLWMHYLADTCLTHKLGSFPVSSADKHELRNFRKRALTYKCCRELLWDEFFAGEFLAAA